VARRPIERLVAGVPRVTLFKPAGVPGRELEQSRLGVDELEAMRLVDGEGLSHEEAAERMGVSRQTVGRVLEVGRKKVVGALTGGQAIVIDGGQYRVGPQRWRCRDCGTVFEAECQSEEVPPCPACGATHVGLCLGYGDGRGGGGPWRRGADAPAPGGPRGGGSRIDGGAHAGRGSGPGSGGGFGGAGGRGGPGGGRGRGGRKGGSGRGGRGAGG
jgi:predicted DNA-binding protein (UPF0251 family)